MQFTNVSAEESAVDIELIDGSGGFDTITSLALDSKNNPHITYYDEDKGDLRYAYWTGATWIRRTVDELGNVGKYSSIVLDKNDRPHISYIGLGYDYLKYATYSGKEWNITEVDNLWTSKAFTAIVLDSKDEPHICYYGDGKIIHAYQNGNGWEFETVENYAHSFDITLVIDSNDRMHLSYYYNLDEQVKYSSNKFGSWSTSVVTDLEKGGGGPAIAIDSRNRPSIAYHDRLEDGTIAPLKLAKWTGENWEYTTIEKNIYVGDCSLDFDTSNNPHICYRDFTNKRLKYAMYDGKRWITGVVDENSDGSDISLKVDDESAHISYYDKNSNKIKYAKLELEKFASKIDEKDNGGGLSQDEINMMWLIVILIPVIMVIFFFAYKSYQKSQRTPKYIINPENQQSTLPPSQFENKSENIKKPTTPPQPPPPPIPYLCSSCGQPLSIVPQFNRYYCYRCRRYE
jgi:hypothetical protein